MHLKSLTLRGFKSFASSTTLHFEPGITCVVGPNGSGKSNVVDAIAWVLGEQGAKALRGGTMADVIFAGTPARPALGRAEVLLTIDNADGALPIEYSEVTVGRLMFRSGESEYTINNTPCRLLDVQELMSDSGIGRELHVVVGQGQLDAILSARPEERRAFIEEAAGVLKHRKRKEKALRKLEAMQANLTRLADLSAELRRQLGPLGRQAEVARKAGMIQAALRDARLRLLADDLLAARTELADDTRDDELLRVRTAAAEEALATSRAAEADLEAALADAVPLVTRTRDTWYALASLRERFRGTRSLAAERARHLRVAAGTVRTGRDPDELEHEAAAVREQEAALAERLDMDRDRLQDVVTRRAAAEAGLAAEEKALVAAAKAASDRREGLARLAGQVEAARSKAAGAEAEIARVADALASARDRSGQDAVQTEAVESELRALDDGRAEVDARHDAASTALSVAQERLESLRAEERAAESERASWHARRDALALSLAPRDGAAALLEGGLAGVVGRLAERLAIEPGAEAAIAAALGQAADALTVEGVDAAGSALAWLRERDAGRISLVLSDGIAASAVASSNGSSHGSSHGSSNGASPEGAPPAGGSSTGGSSTGASSNGAHGPGELPAGSAWARDLVRVEPAGTAVAVQLLLEATAVVPDLPAALELARTRPGLRAVTRDGDVIGPALAAGGSGRAPSTLELSAAAEEAAGKRDDAARRAAGARDALNAASDQVGRARSEVDAALAVRHRTDARRRALAEQVARMQKAARAAEGEQERLAAVLTAAEVSRDRAYGALTELEGRLSAATSAPDVGERAPDERDRLAAAASAVRGEEVEARLSVRTSEERARALAGRADGLIRAAVAERSAREADARRRVARERAAAIASAVAEAADAVLERLEDSLAAAALQREAAEAARQQREAELTAARAASRTLATELDSLRGEVHRDEVARAEQRMRVGTLESRALEEQGVEPDDLVREFGPDVPVPPDGGEGEPVPYDRAAQQARAATAEKQLTRLGKVNPLALEEYAALQERAAFLSTQLDDVKNTRRDLLLVVEEVDTRVREVFRAAFEDTAREFETVFATLFPGGEGRLLLTDPDDMLTTGIEVEARPPGKKVKRLSLLSGGERSLTAVAMLLAIFRARPSPFYILDEVEAALDDRNLGRLLTALEGLRDRSQLIVITHQKRTMEIADALYGVSMRGDGVTAVISQRLRVPASA